MTNILLIIAMLPLLAQNQPHQEGIQQGREALSSGDFPWYDQQRDALKPVKIEPQEEVAQHRTSDWLAQQRQPWNWSFGNFGFFSELLNVLFWIALLLVLGALLFLLIRVLLKGEGLRQSAASKAAGEQEVIGQIERVENLPFPLTRPQGNLLEEATRCYQAGDYRRAIVYLYSYQLVHLDRHQIIHLAKGKTNRQYLRELRWQPALVKILERTMLCFEDVFFGDHDLDQQGFEECWLELDYFHKQVQEIAGQATAA